MNLIAVRLKEYRTLHGLSQEVLSRAVGISQTQLGIYEAGENLPGVRVLKSFAQVLGWSAAEVGELIIGSSFQKRKNPSRRGKVRPLSLAAAAA